MSKQRNLYLNKTDNNSANSGVVYHLTSLSTMELFNITRFLIHLLFFSICIIPGEFPKPQVKNGIANISTDYAELFKGIKSLTRNIFFWPLLLALMKRVDQKLNFCNPLGCNLFGVISFL